MAARTADRPLLLFFNLYENVQLMKRDIYCYLLLLHDQISLRENVTLAAFQHIYAERRI